MAEEIATAIAQSQGSSTKKRVWKKEKVWVEEYLHLLHSRQTLHLTINQLNQVPSILFILCTFQFSFSFSKFSLNTLPQVIRIHGFKKIHHAPKVQFSITLILSSVALLTKISRKNVAYFHRFLLSFLFFNFF